MTVVFNVRVRYSGHFPLERGDELRINLQAIDGEALDPSSAPRREGVAVADGETAGVRTVTVDGDQPTGPVLRIQFDRPTSYQIGQSGSFERLSIVFPTPGSNASCSASPGRLRESSRAPGTARALPNSEKISHEDFRTVEASMDEARAALKQGRNREAIRLLVGVLKYPEHEHSAEARELLARARGANPPPPPDRSQTEFADFLLRAPDGNLERNLLRKSLAPFDGSDATLAPTRAQTPRTAPNSTRKEETRWTLSGGVSSFYVRDDSVSTTKDISIAPDPNADPDAHRVHQNSILTNFDLYGSIINDEARTKIKIAGSDEHRIDSSTIDTNRYGISTAFVETNLRESDLTARVGRQTRNTGGVIGRFDGGVLSWGLNGSTKLNAVAGAANWSRFDAPFKDGKYLYGASVDVAKIADGLDATLFGIQQTDRSVLDRRAVGAEFRYFNANKAALGTIDYDVHFGRLNAAIGSGSWTFDDKSVLSGAVDYRRVPYLSSWNALQGQPFLTLYDMLKVNGASDVRQFALDRTPVFKSAMASYSRPINDNYQVIVDGTVTHLSGTPPSGGVDGTIPSGTEYYFSGQILGQNIFSKGDIYTAAARFAQLADSRVYFVDLNARYPITDDLRINPRLRVGLREGTHISLNEKTILPSLLLDYNLSKDIGLEGEIGTKWVQSEQSGVRSTTKDLFVTLGVRSNFSSEGAYRCAGVLAPCVGLLRSPAQGEEAATQDRFFAAAPALLAKSGKNVDAAPLAIIETGLRYGYGSGKNTYDYYADDTTTQRVSRLSYDKLAAHSGEVFFRADARSGIFRNFFVKGYAGLGTVHGGALKDEDFPPQVDYSKTLSQSAGRLHYLSADLGYNVYANSWLRVGAFAGFHSWMESINASGCAQVGGNPYICTPPIPSSVKLITERDRWNSFRVGAAVDVKLTDRLTLNGELALTGISQRAQDTHYFTFGADPAKGNGAGFQAESVLKYQLTDDLSIGVGGRWWRSKTHAIDTFGQLLDYRSNRFGAFGQVSYRFNLGHSDSPVDE